MTKSLTLLLSVAVVLILNGVSFGGEYSYVYTPTLYDSDGDLYDLEHSRAYSWEIVMNSQYGSGEEIIRMDLTFNDIHNYDDSDNTLFLSVLDSPGEFYGKALDWDRSGSYWEDYFVRNGDVDIYSDSDNGMNNYFTSLDAPANAGSASELLSIVNMDSSDNTFTITFTKNGISINGISIEANGDVESINDQHLNSGLADLFSWAQDGVFELGFDPDCHFYNSGISLTVYTSDSDSATGSASNVPEPETMVLFGLGLLGASAFGRKRFCSMS